MTTAESRREPSELKKKAGSQVSDQELEAQNSEENVELEADEQVTETGTDEVSASGVEAEETAGTDLASELDQAAEDAPVLDEAAEAAAEAGMTEAAAAEAAAEEVEQTEEEALEAFRAKLRRQPGDWYVIHSYAGYENRVKVNLETRIQTLNMEDFIYEIQVPMEEVVEIKNTTRKLVKRVRIPGYVLVRMDLTDASWGAVRHTPGVTGFVGNAHNPVPLSLKEVASMLEHTITGAKPEARQGRRQGRSLEHADHRQLRGRRVGDRQRRSVRDPAGDDLRDQAGIPAAGGAGDHLRARNPGDALVQPGHQDPVTKDFVRRRTRFVRIRTGGRHAMAANHRRHAPVPRYVM